MPPIRRHPRSSAPDSEPTSKKPDRLRARGGKASSAASPPVAAPRAAKEPSRKRGRGAASRVLPPETPASRSKGAPHRTPQSGKAAPRDEYRVRPADLVVRTDPDDLAETARESAGLLELVPVVARRALELGLSAREPSFHVFVAA